MTKDTVLLEARKLYKLGFAVHWLHPKSKRPVESGWTTGPRKKWDYLKETYFKNLNLGVRLGSPSKIGDGYLAVVDVDVKSISPHHKEEALQAAKRLLGGAKCPIVTSGRGNGSRHYYCLTREPFKTFNPAQSSEMVKVHMPSKKPSKKELEELTEKEIADGMRISPAWEISLYSDGRQVVLPPSIHPDSGKMYSWLKTLDTNTLPVIDFHVERPEETQDIIKPIKKEEPFTFTVKEVDLGWLPISDKLREGIIHGTGVNDRSGFLLFAASGLFAAGLDQDEILSVLTVPSYFLGACSYEHAKTKNRARAAYWLYRYTLKKVLEERSAVNAFSKVSDIPEERVLTASEVEKQSKEILEERDWRQDLARSGQNGSGPPKATIENVVLILENVVGANVVRRNEFAFRDTYGCKTPWGGKTGKILTDDDDTKIKYWLGQNFRFEPKKDVITDALTIIACKNGYDPVKDYLNSLPQWDHVPRLDTWLSDNFNAEGDPEYLAQVFRKWLVAMIMRVYEPGAKFDWMPIFEGAQGIGKSSFGRLLVGNDYFLDWLPNLADKDSALALQGMWGIEMGELANMRKTELEVVKGYITRTVDKVRPPFGRRWIESPRRCVFFGTTNRETYLSDESGNRRFKPVKVGRLNFEELKEDRDQLFSEAKYLFENFFETEETLDLTGNAKIFELKIQGEKMVSDDSDVMIEKMQVFLEKLEENGGTFNPLKFRMTELFQGIGPLFSYADNARNHLFAGKMIKKMGGRKFKSSGKPYWKLSLK